MTPLADDTTLSGGLMVEGLDLWSVTPSTRSPRPPAPASTFFTFVLSSSDTQLFGWLPRVPFSEAGEDVEPDTEPAAFELANRDRLELLAKRFVEGSLDREYHARLAIAERIVDRLAPMADESDFEKLSQVRKRVEELARESDADWERLPR